LQSPRTLQEASAFELFGDTRRGLFAGGPDARGGQAMGNAIDESERKSSA
jgi:hypothetical protein